MRQPICLSAALLAACSVDLGIAPNARVLCEAAADCPGDLVCVVDLGRCDSRTNPCIQAGGDTYVASAFGTGCSGPEGEGICAQGQCEVSTCGDGFADASAGEACDNGAGNSNLAPDACREDCQPARCGDGVVDPARGEQCDDGAANGDGGACSTSCTRGCGDGHRQANEECDDGNFIDGIAGIAPGLDHCDHDCSASRCGNGVVSLAGGEQCDDANDLPGDGCSAECKVERGFVCGNIPSDCATICGDGLIAGDETCDDGLTASGDGCDANCQVESGWGCDVEPSRCTPTWYVNQASPPGGDGLTWSTAFNSLQDALAAANAGVGDVPFQDVWIAAGTYRPAAPGGSREATFVALEDTRWLAGFAGGETRASQRDPAAHPVILSGDLDGDDGPSFANRDDNVCHVVTVDRSAPDASLNTAQTLDGLIIEGGQADAAAGSSCAVTVGITFAAGGGILMQGRAVLRNLLLRGNQAVGANAAGGGLFVMGRNTPVRVYASRFEGNAAAVGGGAYISPTSAIADLDAAYFHGCIFHENLATDSGGALLGTALLVVSSTFTHNQAGNGGAINASFDSAPAGNPVLLNVVFDNNTAINGGAYSWYSGGGVRYVYCVHCTVLNSSIYTGGFSLSAVFRNSIVHNSPVTISPDNFANADYSFVNPATLTGTGNVVGTDPGLNSSYLPGESSPVLDVAHDTLVSTLMPDLCDVDRDGDRKILRTYDFGKDPCDLDADGVLNEPIPVDRAGQPRRNDLPSVGNSVSNMGDLGALER